MKLYKTANDNMRVGAYEENGKFYLIIEKRIAFYVATKNSNKKHIEYDYRQTKKEFSSKDHANNYFKGIKRNNPTLKAM